MSRTRFRLNSHSISHCNWTRTHKHLVRKRPVWPNGWVSVYEPNVSGFESSWSHLNFRFRACFEQGVPWHLGNYRVWIHSENPYVTWQQHTATLYTWKNIQSNAPYRKVPTTQLSYLASLAKWLSVHLWSGCWLEPGCSPLNFQFHVCFERFAS